MASSNHIVDHNGDGSVPCFDHSSVDECFDAWSVMFREHSALSLRRYHSDGDMAKFVLSKEKLQSLSKECSAAVQHTRVAKLHSMKRKKSTKTNRKVKPGKVVEITLSDDSAPHDGAVFSDVDVANSEAMNVMRTLFMKNLSQDGQYVVAGHDNDNLRNLEVMRSLYNASTGKDN